MNKEQPREILPIVKAEKEFENEERGVLNIIQSNQCSPPMLKKQYQPSKS